MNTSTASQTQVNINLTEIDQKISVLKAKRKELWEQEQGLIALRDGLLNLQDRGLEIVVRDIQKVRNGAEIPQQVQSPPQHYRGVGEFILNYLKEHPKAETKEIMAGWAKVTDDTVENVRNNVQNTLSRLKSSRQINNKENPGGRRAGSKWFLLTSAQRN